MKESQFIFSNKDKWKNFEEELKNKNISPEFVEYTYNELSEDLTMARTRFPQRSIRVYLNNRLSNIYQNIFLKKRFSIQNIIQLFSKDIPISASVAGKMMWLSCIFVLTGFIIGWLGNSANEEFGVLILGEQYIEITKTNIENNNPLGIYGIKEEGTMFTDIFFNNFIVSVTFLAFGLVAGIGTAYLLIVNGIVLGVFTQLFISYGLEKEFALTVLMHGALEITGMIVEGGAGLLIGYGLLFPGKMPKKGAFIYYSNHALKIFIGCVPVILLAAFIESYITRHTDINNFIRIILIISSFLFMITYFFVIPYMKYRYYKPEYVYIYRNNSLEKQNKYSYIKSKTELLSDSLIQTFSHFGRQWIYYAAFASIFLLIIYITPFDIKSNFILLLESSSQKIDIYTETTTIKLISSYFYFGISNILLFNAYYLNTWYFNFSMLSIIIVSSLYLNLHKIDKISILNTIFSCMLLCLLVSYTKTFNSLILAFLAPAYFMLILKRHNISFKSAAIYIIKNYLNTFGTYILLCMVYITLTTVFFVAINYLLSYWYLISAKLNLIEDLFYIYIAIYITSFMFFIKFSAIYFQNYFNNILEKETGIKAKNAINGYSLRNKLYGIEI